MTTTDMVTTTNTTNTLSPWAVYVEAQIAADEAFERVGSFAAGARYTWAVREGAREAFEALREGRDELEQRKLSLVRAGHDLDGDSMSPMAIGFMRVYRAAVLWEPLRQAWS